MKMRTRNQLLGLAIAIGLLAGNAMSAMVEIRVESRPAELTANATIYELFITTDDDIVSYEDLSMTVTGGTLYNLETAFGSDVVDPSIAFGGFEPLTFEDSFVSTPGDTSVLVNDMTDAIQPTGIPLSTWADFEEDGPVTDFQMARFTLIDGPGETRATAMLMGTVALLATSDQPIPINGGAGIFLPEPTSGILAGLAGLFGLAFRRRR